MIHLSQESETDGLHASLGANIVAFAVIFEQSLWHGFLLVVVWGLFKEALFDPYFEDAETNGGLEGGVRDFLGYIVGALVSIGLIAGYQFGARFWFEFTHLGK